MWKSSQHLDKSKQLQFLREEEYTHREAYNSSKDIEGSFAKKDKSASLCPVIATIFIWLFSINEISDQVKSEYFFRKVVYQIYIYSKVSESNYILQIKFYPCIYVVSVVWNREGN